MKKEHGDLPREVEKKLAMLDDMSDEDIDFSDIPEITDWTGARRGVFYKYRPHQETGDAAAGRRHPGVVQGAVG